MIFVRVLPATGGFGDFGEQRLFGQLHLALEVFVDVPAQQGNGGGDVAARALAVCPGNEIGDLAIEPVALRGKLSGACGGEGLISQPFGARRRVRHERADCADCAPSFRNGLR